MLGAKPENAAAYLGKNFRNFQSVKSSGLMTILDDLNQKKDVVKDFLYAGVSMFGKKFSTAMTIIPLTDEKGHRTGTLLVGSDMLNKKRIEMSEKTSTSEATATENTQLLSKVAQLQAANAKLKRTNKNLELLVKHDPLTGLHNRRYFQDTLESDVNRANRYQTNISLVMIDIDDFKKINDTYGHPFGDKVLQALARKMSESIRKADTLSRYGGEEFAVILPHTSGKGAMTLAEKIRKGVADMKLDAGYKKTSITISLGVAARGKKPITREALLENADTALYKAKASGKNCVKIYEPVKIPSRKKKPNIVVPRPHHQKSITIPSVESSTRRA
jgi:diguanylate cyclase (GGDEF)-like protein